MIRRAVLALALLGCAPEPAPPCKCEPGAWVIVNVNGHAWYLSREDCTCPGR